MNRTAPANPDPSKPAKPRRGITRRRVLIGAGLVGGSLLVGGGWLAATSRNGLLADALSLGAKEPAFSPFGAFIKIAADGSVTVISKHLEMGQGSHAGLAAIVAEELDADWSQVKVEQAVANAGLYANKMMGIQGTGGSSGIANSWDQLRLAGAAARAMFLGAAAKRWSVAADTLAVKDSMVRHAPSGKSASFAELMLEAAEIPPPKAPRLKQPSEFTLIGTDRVRRKDSLGKSTGTARYTQDVQLPNMLVAMVAHPPRFGALVRSFDASAVRAIAGVVDVVQIPSGVAVLAEHTYAARLGRDALKVTWDDDKTEKRSSDQILTEYHEMARGRTDLKAQSFQAAGDPANAFSGELFEAEYDFPFLAHAPMEPMNCVAQIDGRRAKLTFASQIPTLDQLNSATIIGTLPGWVEIETLPAGGSFGRRANPTSDFVVECVQIARHVGGFRPVKLVWTREDDMTAGRYRPMAHHAIAIKTDAAGYPAAWRHRIVCQSVQKGVPGAAGLDKTTVEGVEGSPYLKATPIVDGQVYIPDFGVPVLWWRSVGATHTAMAMEHTIDRLAHKAGIDPAEYRRALYTKAGAQRHLAALNLACEKAGWGTPLAAGTARGLAVHESFGSVVAQIAEVSLKNGQPLVSRVVCAIDCGIAVAPSQIAAQMEGGICYGLAAALYGQITLKDGIVEQNNFDTYPVLRMDEAPAVETYIVPSAERPSGVGEPGTPLIAPAVANALLMLTGKPTTRLPFLSA